MINKPSNTLKHFLILYGIIILLSGGLALSLFSKKEKNVKLITIEVPAKSGSFPTFEVTPVEKVKDSIVYRDKIVRLPDSTEVNKQLAEAYLKAVYERDSLQQLNLYLSAVQIRTYNETFENDDIKLSMDIETTGYLNSVTPSYTIKEYSLSVPIQQRKKRSIYGGITVSNTLILDNFIVEGKLGFKNKKEDIILFGYDTKENISFTYLINIFNF